MWATRERSGSVIHMITGLIIEDRARRPIVQCLMRSLVVVEREPPVDTQTCFARRAIRLDENFLVLQAAPQPLNEDVVQKPAFAVPPILTGSVRIRANSILAFGTPGISCRCQNVQCDTTPTKEPAASGGGD